MLTVEYLFFLLWRNSCFFSWSYCVELLKISCPTVVRLCLDQGFVDMWKEIGLWRAMINKFLECLLILIKLKWTAIKISLPSFYLFIYIFVEYTEKCNCFLWLVAGGKMESCLLILFFFANYTSRIGIWQSNCGYDKFELDCLYIEWLIFSLYLFICFLRHDVGEWCWWRRRVT